MAETFHDPGSTAKDVAFRPSCARGSFGRRLLAGYISYWLNGRPTDCHRNTVAASGFVTRMYQRCTVSPTRPLPPIVAWHWSPWSPYFGSRVPQARPIDPSHPSLPRTRLHRMVVRDDARSGGNSRLFPFS